MSAIMMVILESHTPVNKTKHLYHYDNKPIQYTEIFHGCKNGNFQMKNCDICVIFAQNIDYGYTLDPP